MPVHLLTCLSVYLPVFCPATVTSLTIHLLIGIRYLFIFYFWSFHIILPTFQEDRCRFNRQHASAYLTDIYSLPAADEIALQQAVGTHGPISVAIDASLPSFLYYKGGRFED